ncbi:MAG TPA: amidohydrolase family protein [Bacteroidota bacterium]|nr:amidohydrolase family protein [Bacteroidota bacterium]
MQNQANGNSESQVSIPRATSGRKIWLRVGTLFDGEQEPIHDAHIVYDAESILYAAGGKNLPPSDLLKPGQTRPDLELPRFTLIPGLIEAHAHLFLEGGELDPAQRALLLKRSDGEMFEAAEKRLRQLVSLGICGVRDAGDKFGVGLALNKLTSSKENSPMPYIDSPGAAIHHRGEYGSFMAEAIEDFPSLKECVLSNIRSGAERIKLIVSDVIDFKSGSVSKKPQLTADEVKQFTTLAKEFSKQTMAHATGDLGIENAIEGGIDSIEHGFFIRNDQLKRMRDMGIAWAPTFAPVQKQIDHAGRFGWDEKIVSTLKKIMDQHSTSLVRGDSLGVQIVAGSDAGAAGVPHGLGLFEELSLMERAGLSPLTVLRCATGNSSYRLRFKEKFGLIKPGYRPRFILTRHSPLDRIGNLKKEKYVIFDGAVFHNNGSADPHGL